MWIFLCFLPDLLYPNNADGTHDKSNANPGDVAGELIEHLNLDEEANNDGRAPVNHCNLACLLNLVNAVIARKEMKDILDTLRAAMLREAVRSPQIASRRMSKQF